MTALAYIGAFTAGGIHGGRADGITVTRLDPTTGGLSTVASVPMADPSWLLASSRTRRLYAFSHTARFEGQLGGAIVTYDIAAGSRGLRRLGVRWVPFPHPTFASLSTDGRHLLVASGLGGGITVVPVSEDGLDAPSFVLQEDGRAVVPFGEAVVSVPRFPPDATFPHSIVAHPDGRHVLVADLVRDAVRSYAIAEGRLRPRASLGLHAGAGPRIVAVGRAAVYVVNERDSTVSVIAYDDGRLSEEQVLPTLPAGWAGASAAGSIQLHPSGAWLYASNRGHDSIAVFEIGADGTLASRDIVPSCPDRATGAPAASAHPRHMAISPDGRHLLVANTYADTVSAFVIDPRSGAIRPTGATTALATPTCVAFFDDGT